MMLPAEIPDFVHLSYLAFQMCRVALKTDRLARFQENAMTTENLCGSF